MHRLAMPPDVLKLMPFATVEHFLTEYHTTGGPRGVGDAAAPACQQLQSYVLSCKGPHLRSGLELMQQVSNATTQRVVPTGCNSLDAVFGGGLREGHLTEVAGESASGKTQLALQLAAMTAMRGEGVVYIDTTSSFSPARLLSIAGCQGGHAVDPSQLLGNILVLRPHSAAEALALLDRLAVAMEQQHQARRQRDAGQPQAMQAEQAWQQGQQPAADNTPLIAATGTSMGPERKAAAAEDGLLPFAVPVSLIVMDSVSAVVTPVLGGQQHSQGHALMLSISRLLKHLADRFGPAVLVTNHIVSGDRGQWRSAAGTTGGGAGNPGPGSSKPAMGEHWRNQATFKVQLYQQADNARKAELIASPTQAIGQEGYFAITAGGLIDIEPPRPQPMAW